MGLLRSQMSRDQRRELVRQHQEQMLGTVMEKKLRDLKCTQLQRQKERERILRQHEEQVLGTAMEKKLSDLKCTQRQRQRERERILLSDPEMRKQFELRNLPERRDHSVPLKHPIVAAQQEQQLTWNGRTETTSQVISQQDQQNLASYSINLQSPSGNERSLLLHVPDLQRQLLSSGVGSNHVPSVEDLVEEKLRVAFSNEGSRLINFPRLHTRPFASSIRAVSLASDPATELFTARTADSLHHVQPPCATTEVADTLAFLASRRSQHEAQQLDLHRLILDSNTLHKHRQYVSRGHLTVFGAQEQEQQNVRVSPLAMLQDKEKQGGCLQNGFLSDSVSMLEGARSRLPYQQPSLLVQEAPQSRNTAQQKHSALTHDFAPNSASHSNPSLENMLGVSRHESQTRAISYASSARLQDPLEAYNEEAGNKQTPHHETKQTCIQTGKHEDGFTPDLAAVKSNVLVRDSGHAKSHVCTAQKRRDKKRKRLSKSSFGPVEKKSKHGRAGGARKDPQWLSMYENLKAYRSENGDCLVRRGYPPSPALASWVAEQR